MKTLKRRRLEGKTDYLARLALLKSEKPRLVVRKTNRYIIAQIVTSELGQDKVLTGITSNNLLAKGWPEELSGSLKSIPAAYLTGLLLGKLAKEKKISEAILDLGLQRNIQKSRIYAVLKGVVDAGIKVPHSSEALPDLAKITNDKVKSAFEKVKEALK